MSGASVHYAWLSGPVTARLLPHCCVPCGALRPRHYEPIVTMRAGAGGPYPPRRRRRQDDLGAHHENALISLGRAVLVRMLSSGIRLQARDAIARRINGGLWRPQSGWVTARAGGCGAHRGSHARLDPNRITTADIVAINTTMRARSPHTAWEALTQVAEELPWLAAMQP